MSFFSATLAAVQAAIPYVPQLIDAASSCFSSVANLARDGRVITNGIKKKVHLAKQSIAPHAKETTTAFINSIVTRIGLSPISGIATDTQINSILDAIENRICSALDAVQDRATGTDTSDLTIAERKRLSDVLSFVYAPEHADALFLRRSAGLTIVYGMDKNHMMRTASHIDRLEVLFRPFNTLVGAATVYRRTTPCSTYTLPGVDIKTVPSTTTYGAYTGYENMKNAMALAVTTGAVVTVDSLAWAYATAGYFPADTAAWTAINHTLSVAGTGTIHSGYIGLVGMLKDGVSTVRSVAPTFFREDVYGKPVVEITVRAQVLQLNYLTASDGVHAVRGIDKLACYGCYGSGSIAHDGSTPSGFTGVLVDTEQVLNDALSSLESTKFVFRATFPETATQWCFILVPMVTNTGDADIIFGAPQWDVDMVQVCSPLSILPAMSYYVAATKSYSTVSATSTPMDYLGTLTRVAPASIDLNNTLRGFMTKQGGKIARALMAYVLTMDSREQEVWDELMGEIYELYDTDKAGYSRAACNPSNWLIDSRYAAFQSRLYNFIRDIIPSRSDDRIISGLI